jgi:hypothetical protein
LQQVDLLQHHGDHVSAKVSHGFAAAEHQLHVVQQVVNAVVVERFFVMRHDAETVAQ